MQLTINKYTFFLSFLWLAYLTVLLVLLPAVNTLFYQDILITKYLYCEKYFNIHLLQKWTKWTKLCPMLLINAEILMLPQLR